MKVTKVVDALGPSNTSTDVVETPAIDCAVPRCGKPAYRNFICAMHFQRLPWKLRRRIWVCGSDVYWGSSEAAAKLRVDILKACVESDGAGRRVS